MQRNEVAESHDFATQLKRSSTAFNDYFKDAVLEIFKGDFEVVEGVTKYKMAETLDQLAGIDLWYFSTNRGVRGVANRIQFQSKCWGTFTIRKSRASGARTEYDKRKFAIENDWLYPVLTMQGYINLQNKPLCFAIAKTEDIIWMIDNDLCSVNRTGKHQKGEAEFYVVRWDEMKKQGLSIYIHRPGDAHAT